MDYILRSPDAIIKRWLRAGASGWRLDVADELPDEFLFELRRQVKNERPDALIIGEVWEDASRKESYSRLRPYLQGAQLDSVMNYPLRSALLEYLKYGNAALFVRRVESLKENYPPQSFACTMNLSPRTTRCGHARLWAERRRGLQGSRRRILRFRRLRKYARGSLKSCICNTVYAARHTLHLLRRRGLYAGLFRPV